MDHVLPRYPVYIPSKGRYDSLTAKLLARDGVPFKLVVQPQDVERYAENFGRDRLLVLPRDNSYDGLIMARNWIKEHSIQEGHARHWQLDDNIRDFHRYTGGKRIRCRAGIALAVCEDFSDRYENVALSGLNYSMFVTGHDKIPPFRVNVHVYSCTLVNNSIPHAWRLRYNDDTDLCLQVLSAGWCTVLLNAFLANKAATMTVKGGNTDDLYQGDGRLRMARDLERMWPGVVQTKRRFGRPQHVIANSWRNFRTPLKLRSDIDLDEIEKQSEKYQLELTVKHPIKSAELQQYVKRVGTASSFSTSA